MLSDGPGASAAGPSVGEPEGEAESVGGAGGEDEAPSEELGLEDDEEDELLELPEDEPDDDGDEDGEEEDEDFGEEEGDLLPPDDDCGGLPLGEAEDPDEPLGDGLLLGEPDGEAAEAKPMRATKRREKTIMWRAISVTYKCVQ